VRPLNDQTLARQTPACTSRTQQDTIANVTEPAVGGTPVGGRAECYGPHELFQRVLFAKITPNLRKIGLLSDRLVAIGAIATDA
jgi:hypothetical protein